MRLSPRLLPTVIVAAVMMLGSIPASAADEAVPDDVAQLIVKVAAEESKPAVAALDRHVAVVEAHSAPAADLTGVVVAEQDADEALNVLNADPRVEYAERDVVLSAADHPDTGHHDWWPTKTGVTEIWPQTTGVGEVVIAVIDTGVDATHPDLVGASFTEGYNFVLDTTLPIEPVPGAVDDDGHGTAVIGAIAAQHNEIGTKGMCPRCTIMPLKALNQDGQGTGSGIAAAVDHAVANGADIINLSLSGYWVYDPLKPERTEFSQTLREAVERAVAANVLVVAAAGNQSSSEEAHYPAVYPGVLAVAASDHVDARYAFSNHGPWVDMAAPGCVYVPALDSTTLAQGYADICGTSFAAPLIAGVAGLLASGSAAPDTATIHRVLQGSGVPVFHLTPPVPYVAEGRVAAAAALAALADAAPPDVSLTAPAAGWARGSVEMTATAADDAAVKRVDFMIDGTRVATSLVAPYSAPLDTTLLGDGSKVLTARAMDTAGLTATSSSVALGVDNTAPAVTISSPADGAIVAATTSLAVEVTDISPVHVTFAVDGATVGSDTTAPYSMSLDTTTLADGAHELVVTATDGAGNTASGTRAFSVSNVVETSPSPSPSPTTTTDSTDGGGGGGGGGAAPAPETEPTESPTPTASPSASPAPVAEFTAAVSSEAEAGATVTTDGADAAATIERPLQVSVTTPVAGTVSMTRSVATSTGGVAGYVLLGLEAVIQAPVASVDEPLVLGFRIHSSALPAGRDGDELEVLRNGSVVADCTGPGATPDPCVGSRTIDGDEVAISVRTSRASVWNFAVATVACPQPAAVDFADTPATSAHAGAIGCAVELGVAKGLSATTYAPAATVTRAQMATFIANAMRVAGAELPAGRDAFGDDDPSVHEAAINSLAAAGVVSGVSSGGYAPDAAVTREQMATFLVKAYEYVSGSPLARGRDAFTDDEGRTHEASINKAAAAGFASGVSATRFAPRRDVRRDQMASFVVRLLDRAVAQGLT